MQDPSRNAARLFLAACLVLVLVPAASAETPAPAPEVKEYTPVTFAGMKVFIDPETGRMRPPTAEESQELAAAMRTMFQRKSEGPTHQFHEDGSVSAVVGSDHLRFLVATRTETGEVAIDCTTGVEGAIDSIETMAAAPAQREEM